MTHVEWQSLASDINEIKKTLATIAVQQEQIRTLQFQIADLNVQNDRHFGTGGAVNLIKEAQDRCPIRAISYHVAIIWVCLGGVIGYLANAKIHP